MRSAAGAIDAVILAGGRGTRMNGADKGLLELHGQALVAHVATRLRPQVAALVVNANRNAETYAQLVGAPVVADAWPDFRGPLAGICAGFAATTAPWLLAVPADMPGLPVDLTAQLYAGRGTARAVYAEIAGDAVYPLCLLHRDLAADLHASVARGELAVRRWLARQDAMGVVIHGWDAVPVNLNTPEALAAAQPPAR